MRLFILILFCNFSTVLNAQDWELIWSDEFNGNSLNSNYWTHEIGTGNWVASPTKKVFVANIDVSRLLASRIYGLLKWRYWR